MAAKKWYVVDAAGLRLGRMSSEIAKVLLGKNKPEFTPGCDVGDCVIVINAEKVIVTGKKFENKLYRRHSGRPGGMKIETFSEVQKRIPERCASWPEAFANVYMCEPFEWPAGIPSPCVPRNLRWKSDRREGDQGHASAQLARPRAVPPPQGLQGLCAPARLAVAGGTGVRWPHVDARQQGLGHDRPGRYLLCLERTPGAGVRCGWDASQLPHAC
eukprot:scaffold24863_cov112-Isochrysis_galbana.AAC.7